MIYKIIFTIAEGLFVILALLAVITDKRRTEREVSFRVIVLYVVLSSIGCIVGMWI